MNETIEGYVCVRCVCELAWSKRRRGVLKLKEGKQKEGSGCCCE